MTDRIKGFLVTLKQNIRADDAEVISAAIMLLKGVIDVTPVPDNPNDYINELRARHELRNQLAEILWPSSDKR